MSLQCKYYNSDLRKLVLSSVFICLIQDSLLKIMINKKSVEDTEENGSRTTNKDYCALKQERAGSKFCWRERGLNECGVVGVARSLVTHGIAVNNGLTVSVDEQVPQDVLLCLLTLVLCCAGWSAAACRWSLLLLNRRRGVETRQARPKASRASSTSLK